MKDFQSYFLEKYAEWPCSSGETYSVVMERLANTVAEYVDASVAEMKKEMQGDGHRK